MKSDLSTNNDHVIHRDMEVADMPLGLSFPGPKPEMNLRLLISLGLTWIPKKSLKSIFLVKVRPREMT